VKTHYSQKHYDWETPPEVFDPLDREFGFTMDVCATQDNAKCPMFHSPAQDGLRMPWYGVCWMNPPYGRAISAWIRKAYESSLAGATVVCLVPARTDTAWWHDYAVKGEVRFLRGRVKFKHPTMNGKRTNAPFPCAIVIFRTKSIIGL
jgi:phage N-6-adenine-methyltransferase